MAGLLLVAMLPASAEVYRCVDGDRVRYTDQPCVAGEVPHALPPAVVLPAPVVDDADVEQAERRRAAAAERRNDADAKWTAEYEARKADQERLRRARGRGEVVEGMSMEDVRRLHGEPYDVSRARGGKAERETWNYVLAGGGRLGVTFTDGRVTAVRSRERAR